MAKDSIYTALLKIFKGYGTQFILKDRKLTLEEVFSTSGLLPALAKRADNLSLLCLGYGIGVEFEKKERSSLGSVVSFDDATPQALTLLMLYDVIEDIRLRSSSAKGIVLDELLYD